MTTQEEVNQRVFETTGKLTGEFSAQENQSAMLALALERLQAGNANVDPYDSSTAAIERMNTAFSNLAQTMLGSLAEGFGTLADFVMGVESASEKMGVAGAKAYEELRKVPELFGQGFGISPDEWAALETRAQSFANAQMENIQKLYQMEEANVISKAEQAEALSRLDDIRTEYLTEQLELLREQNDATEENKAATEGELAELESVIAFNGVALQQMNGMSEAQIRQAQIKRNLATAQKGLNDLAQAELLTRYQIIAALQDQLIDVTAEIEKANKRARSGPGPQKLKPGDLDSIQHMRRMLSLEEKLFAMRESRSDLELKLERLQRTRTAETLKLADKLDRLESARMTSAKREADIDRLNLEMDLLMLRSRVKADELRKEIQILSLIHI